jgi:tetratricopeptide (TPR) repeat protein
MSNLGIVRTLLDGPPASVSAYDAAIAFCQQRGLAGVASNAEANRAEALEAVGRIEEALDSVRRIAADAGVREDVQTLIQARTIEASILTACGDEAAAALAHWLLTAVKTAQHPTLIGGVAPVVASAQLAAGRAAAASALLEDLERQPGAKSDLNYPARLNQMVRTALAAGDRALAERLAADVRSEYPLQEHALCAARAALAEAAGDVEAAASLYAEAAERWLGFGHVPERAHALLGHGRCLVALGRAPEAAAPLERARAIFSRLGARRLLAETDRLSEEAA